MKVHEATSKKKLAIIAVTVASTIAASCTLPIFDKPPPNLFVLTPKSTLPICLKSSGNSPWMCP